MTTPREPDTARPINVGPDRVARAIRRTDRVRAPELTFRQGTVVSGSGGTYSITIGADPTVVPGVRALSGYTGVAGDSVFLLVNGGDLLILGKLA